MLGDLLSHGALVRTAVAEAVANFMQDDRYQR